MGCRVTDVPSGTRQTYGKMANLLFHSPVDVDVSTFPLGPVIKTETSQHSTMNAPYLPTRPSVRVKGPVEGVRGWKPAITRKLPSIVVDS